MTVRQAIAASMVANISEVQIEPNLTISPAALPAVMIARGEDSQTYQRQTSVDGRWRLVCLVSANDRSRPDDLDDTVSTVLEWAEGDPDLGETVDRITVVMTEDDQIIDLGGVYYLSAAVVLDVMGDG